METRSTFDLKDAINIWKKHMSTNCAVSNDIILELESHLLDEIDNLKIANLTEEEAFLIAKKRIGPSKELKEEFAKVYPDRPFAMKVRPYLIGILAYLAFISCTSLLSHLTLLLCTHFHIIHSAEWKILHPIVLMIFGLLLIGSIYIQRDSGSKIIQSLASLPILLGALVISKMLDLGITTYTTTYIPLPNNTTTIELFGISHFNYAIFQIGITVLIIAISIFTYFQLPRSTTFKFLKS